MAVAQQDPVALKDAWVAARVEEFKADPDARDKAIAIILYDSLSLNQMMNELAGKVREGGIGGLIKGLMSGKS